jgi:hypothetical protein
MLMIFLLSIQLAWLAFAFFSGPEEAHFTWPFRELGEKEFPILTKQFHSKRAHAYGWTAVAVVGLLVGATTTFAVLQKFDFGFYFFLCSLLAIEYSWIFDSTIGMWINKGIYYLGETAGTDKIIGANRGKFKFYVCAVLSVALNILLISW